MGSSGGKKFNLRKQVEAFRFVGLVERSIIVDRVERSVKLWLVSCPVCVKPSSDR